MLTCQSKNFNDPVELCYFCGVEESTPTGDHIFARGFYPVSQREKKRTLRCPACKKCQPTWKESEEYLINILPLSLDSAHHPAARHLRTDTIQRALKSGRGPARGIYEEGRPCNLLTQSGLLIPGDGVRVAKLDAVRFQPACRKILWGLAYHYFDKEALSQSLECGSRSLDSASFLTKLNRHGPMNFNNSPKLGMGNKDGQVIGYSLYRNPDAPDDIECLLAFYPDLLYRRGIFFHIKTSSFRNVGEAIELTEPLSVDAGTIPAGKYIVVSRTDGVVKIASAGYDIKARMYVALPGPSIPPISPGLLVWFIPGVSSSQ